MSLQSILPSSWTIRISGWVLTTVTVATLQMYLQILKEIFFLCHNDCYKLYQDNTTIQKSWIPKFEFNIKLLKGTLHNATLNTAFAEHLVLSDYNLPQSNNSTLNNFGQVKRYLLKKTATQEAHAFNFQQNETLTLPHCMWS
jgi:hypothetical protein